MKREVRNMDTRNNKNKATCLLRAIGLISYIFPWKINQSIIIYFNPFKIIFNMKMHEVTNILV